MIRRQPTAPNSTAAVPVAELAHGGTGIPPHCAYTSISSHHTTMETFLTPDEILQLVTTGVCTLTDDLMVRMSESYEDSDWYNDPNCVMSRHHY